MEINIDDSQLQRWRDRIPRFLKSFDKEESNLQDQMAAMLLQEIKANAPFATGAYQRSWYAEYMGRFGGWRVATKARQARRLEYGFYGADSLGRNYHQAPQPHVRPAANKVGKVFKNRYPITVRDSWNQTS